MIKNNSNSSIRVVYYLFIILMPCLMLSCSNREVIIVNGKLIIKFDNKMHSEILSKDDLSKPLMEGTVAAEYVELKNISVKDFKLIKVISSNIKDKIGFGKEWILQGTNNDDGYSLEKKVFIKSYNSFPDLLTFKVIYTNRSSKTLDIIRWVNNSYTILSRGDSTLFWSFQGESTNKRHNWIMPIAPGFNQENFMGMNGSDYGGGIPVTDVWRSDQGIAIGHVELMPKLVSLPVSMDRYKTSINISIEKYYKKPFELTQNDSLSTDETFVTIHSGDYYTPLEKYGKLLRAKGLEFVKPENSAYESSWCAWGYERDFTVEEIIGTLPKVKDMGIKWVTIDDGYQQAVGDWHVNTKKFPGGDAQMKALVDKIHSFGLKAMLWWAPMSAVPNSKLLQKNPNLKLLNEEGNPQFISWWDAYYLSPAYDKTIQHTKEIVDLFINKWGFDGLKMDGQFMNTVPPDYNPLHHLEYPEQSFEKLPIFFQTIYETAHSMKPNVVIQNCPCGTCMSIYNMPSMNLAVASDPLNSWQVRLKGKTYKAILGKTAYFGDHIELSDGGNDFASSFGIGAVPGTKFTWPKENPTVKNHYLLTPEKEQIWKKWFSLYQSKMLSKENYLGGLYDIGYYIPETHVIQKSDTLFYAFYNKEFNGNVELRGLSDRLYQVYDYVNDIDYGKIQGKNAMIKIGFKNNLLIEVFPIKK